MNDIKVDYINYTNLNENDQFSLEIVIIKENQLKLDKWSIFGKHN